MKSKIAAILAVLLVLQGLVLALPALAVPAAPSNLTATIVSARQVNLTWQDNATDEKEFRVERANDAGFATGLRTFKANSAAGQGGLVSLGDNTVTAGSTFFYRVLALDNQGVASTASNTVEVVMVIPAAPANLVALATGPTRVELTWSDVATNEVTYDVDRSLAADFVTRVSFEFLPTNSTSFVDTTAQPLTTYFYRVQATNPVGDSPVSNVVTVTTPDAIVPAAPTGLTFRIVAPTRVDLSWTDVATTETAYHVEKAPNVSFAAADINHIALPANSTSFSDLTVSAGQTAFYRVHASNGAVDSAHSNVAQVALVVPAAPSGLNATAAGPGQVDLSWADSAVNESGFRVERSTNGVTFSVVNTVATDVTNSSDTTAAPGTQYTYRVIAFNGVGDSAASNTARATTAVPTQAPAAAANVVATAISATRVDLSWTDPGNLEAGFRIERATGTSTTFTAIGSVGANVTSFVDGTTVTGTAYTYRVIAFNAIGDAPVAVSAAVTTPAAGGGAAPPPAVGGGGGGGFGVPNINVSLSGLTSETPVSISTSGVASSNVVLRTASGELEIVIPASTALRDAQRNPLSSLNAAAVVTLPQAPAQKTIILARELGPSGATFDPRITLTFSYDPAQLPAGASEDSLEIVFWDGTKWAGLATAVNSQAHAASAQVTHFTVFALMASAPGSAPIPEQAPVAAPQPTPATSPATPPPAQSTPTPSAPAQTTPTTSPPSQAATPVAPPLSEAIDPGTPVVANWGVILGISVGVAMLVFITILTIERQRKTGK